MRAGGYDLSHLFGIRNFYYRFGYVRSWEPTAYIVNRDELPREGPPLTLQRFEPRHRDDLARLYNRENARITGTAVRPTYQVRLAYSLARFQGYEWRDGAGRVSGYVVLAPQENHVDVIDFAGPVEQVLRALGVLARRLERREVRFGGLSWEHPLCKRLRRGYCRSEISHAGNAGPLASLVNLPSALRKLSSEMSGLLKASHLADWRGELLIGGSREKATLAINRARVSVEPPRPSKHRLIGGDEVVRLLLGSAEPEEIIEAARMRLSGDARALCAILFPNRRPMLSPWDGY
jgi:hypothetical protein